MLADPEQRANTLLCRLGGPAKEQDRSLPEGFLMEMMALRESIDAHLAAGDRSAVEAHLARAEESRGGHIRRVGELFRTVSAPGAPATLAAIRRELNAWRYIERLIEQIAARDSGGQPA
ncbi:MAG: iron-sulfur cluster co-chaperone HscB C-terminal domain-containing protein [Phycisphaerales bacterium]